MIETVRPASLQDIPAVVSVHLSAFPDFFLTSLGETFLSHLYAGFVEEDIATLLVIETQGHIVGFAAGVSAPKTLFQRMRRKRGLHMIRAAIPQLLRHPVRVAERLFAAIRYRGDQPPDLPDYWLLSSLGIAADCTGRGFGQRLVSAFCELAVAASAKGVYLLTDADSNGRTLAFYSKCGFVYHSLAVRRDGRRLSVITWSAFK